MKKNKDKNYALAGFAAGSVFAAAPVAAGFIINRRHPIDENDILLSAGDKFVTESGKGVELSVINLDDFIFASRKNGEYFGGGCRETFDEFEKRFGNYGAREIYGKCLENMLTPADIKVLGKMGINCIRIPIRSYLLFKNENIKKENPVTDRLDAIIEKCRKAGIYVILSLSSVPGYECGKGADSLSDNDRKTFEKRNQIVKLWAKLSTVYKDNATVAGYEILTDCKGLDEETYSNLCRRTAGALRSLDDKHIVFSLAENIEECSPQLSHSVLTYKGSDLNTCIYCKVKDVIDIARDSYAEINEKLANGLKTETYTETSSLK